MRGPKKLHFTLVLFLTAVILIGFSGIALFAYAFSQSYKNIKIELTKNKLESDKIDKLMKLQANFKNLQSKADLIGRSLPDTKEASRLVSQIESLMCASNPRSEPGGSIGEIPPCIIQTLSFGSTSPIPEELKAVALKDPALSQSFSKGDLALFTITLTVNTNYTDAYLKLKKMENFSRFFHISRVDLTPATANNLNATFNMYTYYQPEKINVPEETAKPAEQ